MQDKSSQNIKNDIFNPAEKKTVESNNSKYERLSSALRKNIKRRSFVAKAKIESEK